MFAAKRTISAQISYVAASELPIYRKSAIGKNSIATSAIPDKLSYITQPNDSTPGIIIPTPIAADYRITMVSAPIVASAVALNSIHTFNISQAFSHLREGIINRGITYANNSLASRRGYIAENYVAGSYNVNATIKRIPDSAIVPQSTKNASPDIVYDGGKKAASLKYYQDAASSANAQTNPEYGSQTRIIPSDQTADGQMHLREMARRNDAKGRTDVANSQRGTAEQLGATIKGRGGAESTPLSKDDADKLANSIRVDKDGNIIVDKAQIDGVLEKTEITQSVRHAKMINELHGIGIAAAIGLGTGFAIGFLVSLAQNGLNPSSLKYAFAAGAKQGGGSAVTAAGATLIGAVMQTSTESLTEVVVSHLGSNVASETAKNIAVMCKMGGVGSLTIIAFSVYNFAKLKQEGYGTKESLLRTGKSAALSFSTLIISIVAQGIWGGCAGLAFSLTAGVIWTGNAITKQCHDKKVTRHVTYYSIELCQPSFGLQ